MAGMGNKQVVESSNNSPDKALTSGELIDLKKELAEEIVDKLLQKDSSLFGFLLKKPMLTNYLVEDGSLGDMLFDELFGSLGEEIGLISKTLKDCRGLLNEIHRKSDFENIKTKIFNKIGGTEQVQTTTQESSTPTENSSKSSGKEEDDEKDTEKNNEEKGGETDNKGNYEQFSDSNVEHIDKRIKYAIDYALNIATNDNNGYTYGGGGKKNSKGGREYDCASLVGLSLEAAGFKAGAMSGRALKNTLLNQGFTYLTPCPKPDKFKPGDILISPTHVEMYTLNGKVVGAHDDKDRQPGDSGGEEISVRNIEKVLKYMKPSGVLRYTGESTT